MILLKSRIVERNNYIRSSIRLYMYMPIYIFYQKTWIAVVKANTTQQHIFVVKIKLLKKWKASFVVSRKHTTPPLTTVSTTKFYYWHKVSVVTLHTIHPAWGVATTEFFTIFRYIPILLTAAEHRCIPLTHNNAVMEPISGHLKMKSAVGKVIQQLISFCKIVQLRF